MIASDARFRAALEPVLDDLTAVHPSLIRLGDGPITWGVNVWLWDGDGSGVGLSLDHGLDDVDAIVNVADQVQDFVVEALWAIGASATWPSCPLHPDTHPLRPARVADRAVWECPRTGDELSAIGAGAQSEPPTNTFSEQPKP